jgi:hypothetical protein
VCVTGKNARKCGGQLVESLYDSVRAKLGDRGHGITVRDSDHTGKIGRTRSLNVDQAVADHDGLGGLDIKDLSDPMKHRRIGLLGQIVHGALNMRKVIGKTEGFEKIESDVVRFVGADSAWNAHLA